MVRQLFGGSKRSDHLVVDADDRFMPPDVEALRAVFARLGDENVGYSLTAVSVAADGGMGAALEQVRLFPRRPELRWEYRVHEQIIPNILRHGGTLAKTGARLVHVGYRDDSTLDRKIERNLLLVERDCEEHPGDPFPQFNRGSILAELGRSAEAIIALTLCAPLIDRRSGIGRALAYNLARAQRAEGLVEDALGTLRAARAVAEDAQLACQEAEVLVQSGDLHGAAACLSELPAVGQSVATEDLRARVLLGEIFVSIGLYDATADAVRPLTEARPGFGRAWLVLADALLARGRIDEVQEIVDRLSTIRDAEIASAMLRAAMLHRGGREAEAISTVEGLASSDDLLARFLERIRGQRTPAFPLVSCFGPPW